MASRKRTKTQEELYKEYRNLIRRTKKYAGNSMEVENNISSLLSQSRKYLNLPKLSPKTTTEIKQLTKELYSYRGEKLSKNYINKERIRNFSMTDRYGEVQEGRIMSDETEAKQIIQEYKEELRTQLTNFNTGKEHRKSGDDFHGLDSLLLQLEQDINSKGVLVVASMINQFSPSTSLDEKYYAIETFEFLRTIGYGDYELPESVTDEEAEEMQ